MFLTDRCFLFIFLFFGLLIHHPLHAETPEELVTFDRGGQTGARVFISAERCDVTPCVITQDGAIRISPKRVERYKVEIGLLHDGLYRPVDIFQAASPLDKRLSERLFSTQQNRKIFDLSSAIEAGKTDTIYIYGLQLHYELHEGDPLILTFTDRDNVKEHRDYYFRYHQDGASWEGGVAVLLPAGIYLNNEENIIQGSTISIAASLSRRVTLDPDQEASWGDKVFHAWRGNLFLGLVNRRILAGQIGDNVGIVNEQLDGFIGVGITVFDFVIWGVGTNLTKTPKSAFPFVGVEMRHFDQFLRSLKKSTHEKWLAYQEREKKRSQ